jgi:hypothetical protein
LASPQMVPAGEGVPMWSDAVGWCERIADHVAHGASAEYVRKYLKSISRTGWQLVNWLTHTEGATQAAILALELTQHVLGTFGTALFRHVHGIPDRCPRCSSYRLGLRSQPEKRGLPTNINVSSG